jgi:cytochrome P450
VAQQLVDDLADQHDRCVDLKKAFAYPLPIWVISDYMGVPAEASAQLRDPIDQLLTVGSPDDLTAALAKIRRVLRDLVQLKRSEPGDDLISQLIQARDAQDRLSDPELVEMLQLLISAGHETTVNLITNTISHLLQDPSQLDALLSGSRPWSAAVEEGLRLGSPVRYALMRYTTEPTTIAGVSVPAGEPVIVAVAAAGLASPAVADRFDVLRTDRARHLSFGHAEHHCPGAALARAETEIALATLIDRCPKLGLERDAPPHLHSIALWGLTRLKVRLTP